MVKQGSWPVEAPPTYLEILPDGQYNFFPGVRGESGGAAAVGGGFGDGMQVAGGMVAFDEPYDDKMKY